MLFQKPLIVELLGQIRHQKNYRKPYCQDQKNPHDHEGIKTGPGPLFFFGCFFVHGHVHVLNDGLQ